MDNNQTTNEQQNIVVIYSSSLSMISQLEIENISNKEVFIEWREDSPLMDDESSEAHDIKAIGESDEAQMFSDKFVEIINDIDNESIIEEYIDDDIQDSGCSIYGSPSSSDDDDDTTPNCRYRRVSNRKKIEKNIRPVTLGVELRNSGRPRKNIKELVKKLENTTDENGRKTIKNNIASRCYRRKKSSQKIVKILKEDKHARRYKKLSKKYLQLCQKCDMLARVLFSYKP